jgi:hypothetical protein
LAQHTHPLTQDGTATAKPGCPGPAILWEIAFPCSLFTDLHGRPVEVAEQNDQSANRFNQERGRLHYQVKEAVAGTDSFLFHSSFGIVLWAKPHTSWQKTNDELISALSQERT